MNKRSFIKTMAILAGTGAMGTPLGAQTRTTIEVWKDPDCGCCQDWVAHLEANGFQIRVHDSGNTAARTRLGMPAKLGACHTAQAGAKAGTAAAGYAIEGHVPAREIHRLLKERPSAIGLAVPGMPVGSPGMDGAIYGGRKDPYDVLLIQRDGRATVYQSYNRT